MNTLVTNDLFSDFIECKYRAYLKITGATEPKSDLLDVSGRLRERYHSQAREHLLGVIADGRNDAHPGDDNPPHINLFVSSV